MIDWTNWNTYIYPVIAVGSIIIIVVSVKFFLLYRNKKKTPKTEADLKLALKQLKVDEKKELVKLKESKLNVSRTVKIQKGLKPEETRELDTKLTSFSFAPKGKFKFLTLTYWKSWYKEKYFPTRVVLINMEMINGFHRTFKVVEKDGGFVFNNKQYIFDDDSKYYNMDAKLYVFDYHENICIPFRRKIPVTAIKKTIEDTDGIDIENAVNPSTLQRFMTAKIAEGVMKGTLLDEFLRKLQMFIIVIMVAVLVHLALFIYGSGMLKNIQVPFV